MNEFLKYGGEGMITMMGLLYKWIWKNEHTPKRWREGVVVNVFMKEDEADPGNYIGITLLNDRVGMMLEKEEKSVSGKQASDQIVVA